MSNSKKEILKSTSIIGGASFIVIIVGIIKTKFLAVLLGPSGIGLLGVFTSVMTTGTALFGFGLATSGVRQLALNSKTEEKLNCISAALFSANSLLGLLGMMTIMVFSLDISVYFFKNENYKFEVCVLGVGVFASLVSASQMTLLQGLRKVSNLAKVRVNSSLIAAVLALAIVWYVGVEGIIYAVVAMPIVACSVALFYIPSSTKLNNTPFRLNHIKPYWKDLFKFGFVFMLTALMASISQLLVRYIINDKLGIESVGYFQASWAISMTYIGFVLGAMGADYYPNLTQIIKEPRESNLLVNNQTEVAIYLSAPILLAVVTFSPFVINLLYSSEFYESADILKWQVMGNVLKIICWPIGFIILAKGKGKAFFCTELLWNSSYVLFVYLGVSEFGVQVTGYAFLLSYLLSLILIYLIGFKLTGFLWNKTNIKLIFFLVVSSSLIVVLSYLSPLIGMFIGGAIVFMSITLTLNYLINTDSSNPKINKLQNFYVKIINKFIYKN